MRHDGHLWAMSNTSHLGAHKQLIRIFSSPQSATQFPPRWQHLSNLQRGWARENVEDVCGWSSQTPLQNSPQALMRGTTTIERLTRTAATCLYSPSILLCCQTFFSSPEASRSRKGRCETFQSLQGICRQSDCTQQVLRVNRIKWCGVPSCTHTTRLHGR